MPATTVIQADYAPLHYRKVNITAAEIVALGASTTGTITTAIVLPPKAVVTRAAAYNAGVAAATLATLTVTIGDSGDDDRHLAAQTVFAANAGLHRVGQAATTNQSATANSVITLLFTGNANLSGLTGLTDGVDIIIEYATA